MTCTASGSLIVNSTNVLEVTLRDTITDQPVSGAVINVTLYDMAGNEVGPDPWPITMQPDIEPGEYKVTLDANLEIKVGHSYRAHIVATDGGTRRSSEMILVARRS